MTVAISSQAVQMECVLLDGRLCFDSAAFLKLAELTLLSILPQREGTATQGLFLLLRAAAQGPAVSQRLHCMPDTEQAGKSGLCKCSLKAVRHQVVSFSTICALSLTKAYSGSILTAHAAAQQGLGSQAPRPVHQQGFPTLMSIILHLVNPHSLSLKKA